MKTASARPFSFALAALAAVAAVATSAFGQPLDGLALLVAVGPVAFDPGALAQAVERLSTKATESLDSLRDGQEALGRRVQGVEQRLAADGGGQPPAGAPQTRAARAAAIVKALTEGNGLKALASNAVKRHQVAVEGLSVRAAVTSATIAGQADREPAIYGPLRPRSTLLDLIPSRPTSLGTIEYLKATRTGAAAVQVAEGDAKAELGLAFTLESAKVATVAVWTPASRQVLDDVQGLEDFISGQLLDALDQATELQILTGSGLPGNLSGLMLEASPYTRAQAGDTAIDTLRRAATQVFLRGGTPSGVVLHPTDLESLELARDDEGRFLLSLDVDPATGNTRIWRATAVQHVAVDEGSFLLGDFARATRIHDRQQASVMASAEDRDNFIRNMVTLLAELRLALTTPRPDLLVTGQLVPA